jgi:large repetitive protein
LNGAPTTSGLLENTANVSTTTTDPNAANNSSTASTGVDAGPTDLAITKTASVSQTGFGAPVTYTITVTNNGPSTAFGTTVTDVLPAGTTFQSATPSQGSCANSAGTVTCNLGTLNPSATATIALTVTMPTTAATVSNTATVTAVNAETSPANNASTAALAVTAEVPSLSEYGLALLGIALIAAALWSLRMQ